MTTYADILSERLNVGKVWIGIVLLGIITSLPEAVSSLTAAVFLNAPDLAVGNMVGSNNFNLCLILVMDIVYRQGAVTNRIHFIPANVYPAVFSLTLVFLIISEIWLGPQRMITVGFLGLASVLVFPGYFVFMKILSRNQGGEAPPSGAGETPRVSSVSMTQVILNLAGSALLVVVGAVWLANTADTIAEVTNLGRTFVGTFFLALVTSLPEMVVTISAVKLGALDLAVGNIFGSNMSNMFIISVCDLFYWKGPLLAMVSARHLITAFSSVLLTLVALAGMRSGRKRTWAGVGWDSWTIGFFFLLSMVIMYQLR